MPTSTLPSSFPTTLLWLLAQELLAFFLSFHLVKNGGGGVERRKREGGKL